MANSPSNRGYGEITRLVLDWVELKNLGGYEPRWHEINKYYQKVSGTGGTSMQYHLNNWSNANTHRKCKRYIWKRKDRNGIGRYRIENRQYDHERVRKEHPRLEGLAKLMKRLQDWLHHSHNAGLHEHPTWMQVKRYLSDVTYMYNLCYNNPVHTIDKHTLKTYNNLYKTYNIKANKR